MAGQTTRIRASLQQNKGFWVVRGRVVDPKTGRTRQRSKSTGLTVKGNHKREAQEAMREIVQKWELEAAGMKEEDEHLFSEFAERWLERKRALKVRETTIHSYEDYFRLYIGPKFGDTPMADISQDDLQAFFFGFLKSHSVNTARRVNCVFSGAFQEAVRAGIVPVNLADRDHLDFPKAKKFEGSAYTERQVANLLAVAKQEGEPIYAAVVLAALYGLRRSEVLGLRWRDVDFERGTLTVSNTVVMDGYATVEAEKTKSANSHRVINLFPVTMEYLKALKKAQQGGGVIPQKVVAWPDGKELHPDYITRKAKKLMKQAGLPVIRFHDLRHTAASLLAPVVSPQQLQRFMGHEDISTTYAIYAHYMDKERRATSEAMNGILEGAGISL